MNDSNEQLRESNEQLKLNNKLLEESNEQLRQGNELLLNNNEQLQQRIKQLEENNKQLQASNELLRQRNEQLEERKRVVRASELSAEADKLLMSRVKEAEGNKNFSDGVNRRILRILKLFLENDVVKKEMMKSVTGKAESALTRYVAALKRAGLIKVRRDYRKQGDFILTGKGHALREEVRQLVKE